MLKTVPLDASPIEKDGRTCVPVRFLAESLGLTVEWDDGAQCAVLYDRDALLGSIDSGFTTANRWLAAVPRLQNADAVRMGLTAKLDCTAFDTISGDKKYSASGTMTLVSDGKALRSLRPPIFPHSRAFSRPTLSAARTARPRSSSPRPCFPIIRVRSGTRRST